jgi:pilus assembly protein CpaC
MLSALAISPVLAAKETVLEEGSHLHRADPILMLTLGKAEIVTVPGSISDILVADPKIADVVALQSDKLYIVGASLGDTNIIATDREGNVLKRLNVSVSVDTVAIENMVHSLFPNEENVKVHMIGDQLALTGVVSTPSAAQKIARLVAAHMGEIQDKGAKNASEVIENLLEVRGEQQVMLRVRMLEMSRSVLKELGLETSANDLNEGTRSLFKHDAPSNANGLQGFLDVTRGTALTQDPFGIGALILDTGINGLGQLEFLLNALENDNLANILAEPNLTSVSGEQAGFLAGGEFPVPVGRDREGNIIVEYKEFGVSLNFKPIVLSEDRISLQLNTEVSSLNQSRGITLAEIQIPGLDVRRASTTVEINSGGTLMMAGLLKSESVKGMAGIPGIKDTPVIGDLLSSDSFSRDETELVVLVTPYLVQPYADKSQSVPMINEGDLGDLPPPPPAGLLPPGKEKPVKKSEAASGLPKTMPAPEPLSPNSPLSKAFSKNMNRIYGDRLGDLSKEKQSYGYMLE